MDQITADVRMAEWTALIQQCQERPEGQTAKQWLEENGVSSKKYYYWLRKVRNQVYNDSIKNLPAERECSSTNRLAYIELQDEEPTTNVPTITIRTKKATIEIAGVSDDLAVRLVKAVSHAI
jgi:putative transposase